MKLSSAALLAPLWIGAAVAQTAAAKKPNVIVILTDDQDQQLGSVDYMYGVQKHLMQGGMTFKHHYCTVALCCPSRVNMWTGKAAHNTNVTDLSPPYGGFPKFIDYKWYQKWLPTFLKGAGYDTYFTGKLMNSHSIHNYQMKLDELSLDGHDFLLEPGTYQYTNPTFQHNDAEPQSYPGVYATDMLSDLSLKWIDKSVATNTPFFLAINPVNPHGNHDAESGKNTPPIPAKRHAGKFAGLPAPQPPNFNPDRQTGASWVADLPRLDADELAAADNYFQKRLEAILAVDDLLNATIARLTQHNILDNTYILYTSDNGFHIGNHRLGPGKRCPYEEDVNVPFFARGPKITPGSTFNLVTSHTDIVPTILDWVNVDVPNKFDGKAIPVEGETVISETEAENWEHAQVESWGAAKTHQKDPIHITNLKTINTYKALRVIGKNYNLFYSVWCDGDHEIYNMKDDASQIHNLYNTQGQLLGVSIEQLTTRLDTLLLVLKTCAGKNCYQPWAALHPGGSVNNLKDALDPKYDNFYANQDRVKFGQCAKGYVLTNEQPTEFNTFGGMPGKRAREQEMWAEFPG